VIISLGLKSLQGSSELLGFNPKVEFALAPDRVFHLLELLPGREDS